MAVSLERVIQYFDVTLAMCLGTRDANLRPDFCRVVGSALSDDNVFKFYIGKKASDQATSNLDDNGRIALTMVNPFNYQCLQIKGRYIRYYEADSLDMANIRKYLDSFGEVMKKLGIPEDSPYNWPHDPGLVIEMELDEVYEQTPKKGAGEKLED